MKGIKRGFNGALSQRNFDKLVTDKYTINLSDRKTTDQIQKQRRSRKVNRLTTKSKPIMLTIAITILIWAVMNLIPVEAHNVTVSEKNKANYDVMGEYGYYLSHFPTEKTVIGCYNDRDKTTREASKCTRWGDHNITLPPRSQIKIWLKYFNPFEITNRLAIVNFESNFDENASNPYAKGYVQTLRKWNIPKDIDSQLQWLAKRQKSQGKVQVWKSKRCGYYWKNHNFTDWYEAWEYGVLSCIYRYHYHAYKGMWYAKRWVTTTKFYKEYMFWLK